MMGVMWKCAYLGAAPVAALGVVLLSATLGKTGAGHDEQSALGSQHYAPVVRIMCAHRNHWGMGRFCLAALARMTLVLKDLLEGISLNATQRHRMRA